MTLAFAESEYRDRLARARQTLQTDGLDGCICVAPEHLYYFIRLRLWLRRAHQCTRRGSRSWTVAIWR